ncbi:bifunctional UDP-N-acetylglucosamine diphosphorylase/glucosamine-1-phosphate N-acetyltransferase GlmU [Helicobacter trogontum]|uniref:Bifunctional protein GlmU n=1 Tax=Helicobacter trogontum TaxID=50960 RepID=A0A4V6HZ92_9HELI|nr:bifunctional UDP-N-acetylglucosamine diphosphorylase/glucosamine-1-phosphate N-acetyltransferase GlmU [Helicobacter trogontum]TLD83592.1 bifunctional UDP-N-acetylglucosamine diphosphorylase/glucosamine-1-phosphate N-acetyltransferase GlmU [Helicobacter trogontum]
MVSVVILAAGFGTRMKSDTPKVLHTLCGKSMIEYVIDTALQISSDVHVVLYNQKEKIQAFLQDKYAWYIADKITFHTQLHDKYPGTGGALMQENKQLIDIKGTKVLILSGDTPLVTCNDLEKLVNGGGAINLCVFQTQNPYGYGRIIKKTQNTGSKEECFAIEGIIEEKDCDITQKQIDVVNAGIYCFERKILQDYIPKLDSNNAQQEYYLTQVIELASRDFGENKDLKSNADSRDIFAFMCCEENMLGINTKLHLSQAEQILLTRLRNKAMEQGVIMQIPESIYIESDVCFEGECVLENGVRITGKSYIKNSHIKAHSVVEESEITQSDIGPHAHIRPNSNIKDSHIGNFVECKNASLEGIKAGHLSYLGDCVIGSGSNVGAGVITCNYDGMKKHKTHIGKNVFIGSDCQLVAPVNIADNVLIGAGSTITKNIEEGSLSLARSKQVNYPNGFYKFFTQKSE